MPQHGVGFYSSSAIPNGRNGKMRDYIWGFCFKFIVNYFLEPRIPNEKWCKQMKLTAVEKHWRKHSSPSK